MPIQTDLPAAATTPRKRRDAAAPSEATAAAPSAAKPQKKSALALKLLARAKGATITEIVEPTGWQPHSTRAFLSGLRKKGMTIVKEQRRTGETAYRIGESADAAPVERAGEADDASREIGSLAAVDSDAVVTPDTTVATA